jgi:hypothetical protein
MKIPIIFLVSLVDEIQSSPSSLPLLGRHTKYQRFYNEGDVHIPLSGHVNH